MTTGIIKHNPYATHQPINEGKLYNPVSLLKTQETLVEN